VVLIVLREKAGGQTEGRTDGRTNGRTETAIIKRRCAELQKLFKSLQKLKRMLSL